MVRRLGDRAWADLLGGITLPYDSSSTDSQAAEIDTAGDGFLALFDGPARALRSALTS